MDRTTAIIARDTLVDVSTPAGSVGVIASLSTRNGVPGATISIGNPLCSDDAGWHPLSRLQLCGDSARRVVDANR
jgi:hypothetical protein